jgi:tellurite resistance-related uncharacterized protein
MADGATPTNLVSSGNTPIFTQETIPDALQREHRLAEGTWGELHVFEGSIRFIDLESLQERVISAPGHITIRPGAPHRVAIEGPVECRIDFFREPHSDTQGSATG